VECYRGKPTKPKRLDGASMQDPSLNLPQGGEIDNESFLNFSDCGSKVQSSGIFIFYGI
jgi:hypothetical protein